MERFGPGRDFCLSKKCALFAGLGCVVAGVPAHISWDGVLLQQ